MSAIGTINFSDTVFSGTNSNHELLYLDDNGDLRVISMGRYTLQSPNAQIAFGVLTFFGLSSGNYIGTVSHYLGSGRYFFGKRGNTVTEDVIDLLPDEILSGPEEVPFIYGTDIYWSSSSETSGRLTYKLTGSLAFIN